MIGWIGLIAGVIALAWRLWDAWMSRRSAITYRLERHRAEESARLAEVLDDLRERVLNPRRED
jgi:hypothetical protein